LTIISVGIIAVPLIIVVLMLIAKSPVTISTTNLLLYGILLIITGIFLQISWYVLYSEGNSIPIILSISFLFMLLGLSIGTVSLFSKKDK
jgi:hypothetical protein